MVTVVMCTLLIDNVDLSSLELRSKAFRSSIGQRLLQSAESVVPADEGAAEAAIVRQHRTFYQQRVARHLAQADRTLQ